MLSFKVSVIILLAATFAVQGEDTSRIIKDMPSPKTREHIVDPGFTFSTTTAKSKGDEVYCTRIYDPICANDKKTYNNKCEFENAQRKDPKLLLVKEGEC